MGKKKEKKDAGNPGGEWIVTYSDMVTLMLCFFVALFDASEVEPGQLASLFSALSNVGMGNTTGGDTLSEGKSVGLGNTLSTLPSLDRGNALGPALRKAISLFNPEIKSKKVVITHDERGLVINLASDVFFDPASARLNIEESREILIRVAGLLNSEEIRGRKFRIEGHTDSVPVDPEGPWESNWELSTARSIAVLHYLTDLGVRENRFQVAGFADTTPMSTNDTPEGRAYNRRVDIIILDDGHL